MDIQDLGALGEFIGSIAIVVTLIFLTVETRQARNATQQSNRQARHLIRSQLNQALAVNPQLAEVMTKSNRYLTDGDAVENDAGATLGLSANALGLSASETLQLGNYFLQFFRHLEDQYFSDLPDTDRSGLESQAIRAIAIPSFARLWEAYKSSFNRQFQTYIDGLSPVSA